MQDFQSTPFFVTCSITKRHDDVTTRHDDVTTLHDDVTTRHDDVTTYLECHGVTVVQFIVSLIQPIDEYRQWDPEDRGYQYH